MSRILDELKFSQKDSAPGATEGADPFSAGQGAYAGEQTVLGADTVFKGSIRFRGFLRIDGKVDGDIESKGTIVVGRTGFVKGKIISLNAKIEGKVEGNIVAEQKVHFFSSAHMRGDVIAAQLAIEEGVTIVGNCDISPDRDKAVTSAAARAASASSSPAPSSSAVKTEEKKEGQKDFGSLLGKTFGNKTGAQAAPAAKQAETADKKTSPPLPAAEKKDK